MKNRHIKISEGDDIPQTEMKENVRKMYYWRVYLPLNIELNSQILRYNNLAHPLVLYNLNILQRAVVDINRLENKTRKIVTNHRMYQTNTDGDRL